ncbi:hypothetical protein GGI43DRAFT_386167 [Trichoderma evansii]
MTALHYAAKYGSADVIKKILATRSDVERPDVERRDKCGYSVLQHAAMNYQEESYSALLGVLPEAKIETYLAEVLPISLKNGAVHIYRSIADKIIDVNTPDRNGWTSLDVAKQYGRDFKIELLRKGAVEGSQKANVPTEWNTNDRHADVLVSQEKKEAWMETYISTDTPSVISGSVRANYCIPADAGNFYFEVEILQKTDKETTQPSAVAVGLLQEFHPLNSLVGWNNGSWGYHSDEAVDMNEKTALFTLDGVKAGKVLKNVTGQLYPAVLFYQTQTGFTPVRVRVNFGEDDSRKLKYGPGFATGN